MQIQTTLISKPVWFVTGASQGLGEALVTTLLEDGYKVAATSRNLNSLIKKFGNQSSYFLPLEMNLSDEKNVEQCVKDTLNYFGDIDVVVNNAGYAQYGFIEEVTNQEVINEYSINVFGLLNVLRHTIPILKNKKSGNIINISSKGGFHAGKATGIYCSSKYAVEGISEALYFEMKEYNVGVTAVKPGGLRTNFYKSLKQTDNIKKSYEDFHALEKQQQNEYSGKEKGNPMKVSKLLIEVTKSENPPLHLFVGSDAYKSANKKFNEVVSDMLVWHNQAVDINYDE